VMASYRSSIVALCGLAGLAPIDPPYLELKDPEGLHIECRKVRDMGFVGKLCIHPSQLEIVNDAFTPSTEEISEAGRILEAVKTQGTGAIVVDGRMVDKPVIRAAERTITMAARLKLETRSGLNGDRR
jgi:(S)-citramalyl-CoA lyase